jgi:ribosomal protein L40E
VSATKICPSCNAEVPAIANLCRHCFHDFHFVPPKKKSPLWTLLFLAVGTAIVSALMFMYIYDQQRVTNISIDRETKSIVFTTVTPDGPDAERVYWKDISTIEYIQNTKPQPFQVWVVATNGERYQYSVSSDPLDYDARTLSEITGKSVVNKDEYDGPKRRKPGEPE